MRWRTSETSAYVSGATHRKPQDLVRSKTLPPSLQVVEPTLEDDRGHTRALVGRFCDALGPRQVDVWASRGASPTLLEGEGLRLHRWFRRRIRTVQLYFLLRKLLRNGDTVFLPTAGRTAIVLAARALGSGRSAGRVVLYVHWLRPTARRLESLAAVARRHPDLPLLTTTETVRALLSDCGFEGVRHVPYPARLDVEPAQASSGFRYLLYAGAARRDKGIHRVVDLVEHLNASGSDVPVRVQVVGDYFDRMDARVAQDIARLRSVRYPGLHLEAEALASDAFRAMFAGAICLQLYDPEDFADRVSGITLDAFAARAPAVVHEGTWMARQVARFGAGRVVPVGDTPALLEAVHEIASDYEGFSAAAGRAAETLADIHDPRHLVEAVVGQTHVREDEVG